MSTVYLPPSASRWGRRDTAALALVGGVGLFVCTWRIGTATIGVDEPVYVQSGWDYVHGDWSSNREHPLLAKELLGLTQRAIGRSIVDVRVLGVVCALLTGMVLFDLVRRLSGTTAATTAGLLWFALPQSPGTLVIRLDRYAGLEPPMLFFGCLALWTTFTWGWRNPRMVWLAAGGAAGLSAAAKLPGVSFAVAPLVAGAMWATTIRARVVNLATTACGVALGLVVPQLPGGWSAAFTPVTFQLDHADDGHAQMIAGAVRLHHPWWANFWWQSTYLGWLGVIALWGTALIGLATLDRTARWCLGGVLGLQVLFLTMSPLKLPHYHLLSAPVLCVAAGCGVRTLRAGTRPTVVGLLGAFATLAVVSARNVGDVATLRRSDYRRVEAALRQEHAATGVVAVWGWGHVLDPDLSDDWRVAPADAADPVVIIVDPVVAERQEGTALAARVADITAGVEPIRLDRLSIYVLDRS